jgi:hypothetical protein
MRAKMIFVVFMSFQLFAAASATDLPTSENLQGAKKTYVLLAKKSLLSDEDVLFLIEQMKAYDGFGRSRPDGPDTEDTQLTAILTKHSNESLPHLINSLNSTDWNVRRYSAFCIGEIGNESSLPELEKAILDEIPLAAKTKWGISVTWQKPMPATYVLRAMIQAYGHIDSRKAVNRFLELFIDEKENFRNYAANLALSILLKETPVPLFRETMYMNYRPEWERWWKENMYKPDNQLFKSTARRTTDQKTLADARNDISKLFEGKEETLLCEDSTCSKDMLELFHMISDKTNISIRPIGNLPNEKYSIYRLSAKDTFLFLIDIANLTYQITDRTVSVSRNPYDLRP